MYQLCTAHAQLPIVHSTCTVTNCTQHMHSYQLCTANAQLPIVHSKCTRYCLRKSTVMYKVASSRFQVYSLACTIRCYMDYSLHGLFSISAQACCSQACLCAARDITNCTLVTSFVNDVHLYQPCHPWWAYMTFEFLQPPVSAVANPWLVRIDYQLGDKLKYFKVTKRTSL